MALGRISLAIAVLIGGSACDARAQTDPIHGIFRHVLTEIAVASELPRLDSAALLPGVRREIRIYDGFGVGGNRVTRLVEHTHGVDGQFGVFWPSQNWMRVYSSPAEERRARRVAWAQLLARLDTLGIDSIPSQGRQEHGVDGWGIIVELRTPARYRAYFYYMPDSMSADSGERASARVAEAVWQALKRRLAGM